MAIKTNSPLYEYGVPVKSGSAIIKEMSMTYTADSFVTINLTLIAPKGTTLKDLFNSVKITEEEERQLRSLRLDD